MRSHVQGERQPLVLHAHPVRQLGDGGRGKVVDHLAPRSGIRVDHDLTLSHLLQAVEPDQGGADGQVVLQVGGRATGDHRDDPVGPVQGNERLGHTRERDGEGRVIHDRGQGAVEVQQDR